MKDFDLLIFGEEYDCWLNGKYIGLATYEDDENIGPSFIIMAVSTSGELVHEVLIPDTFKLKGKTIAFQESEDDTLMSRVYQAVVEFIKRYNQQPKPQQG